MALTIAAVVLTVAAAYLAAGLVFAAAFLSRGLARTDPAAADSPWSFRLVILPSVAALWPVVLRLWLMAERADAERGGRR